ncbi:MAG: response regulator transcription factor [Oscillospiraceae bacterium]|nr:response regulator transcription factor [Oscillospiraceae bacterium]
MYIAVCDDQEQELSVLNTLLRQWQDETHTPLRMQTFRSAVEMLNAARKERFSLYLLDVMMPGIDGIAAAREIRSFDETAEIVFLTSSPGFAYESYGVRAMDYLLKPISAGLLFPVLDRFSLRRQQSVDALTLKCGATIVRIPFSQLSFVEVMSKHLYFNLIDGTTKEVTGSLKEYEDLLLCRPEFMRIHRSYIVNMLQVAELSPSCIHTFSGRELPVSRRLYPQLQKDYMNLLFAEREG